MLNPCHILSTRDTEMNKIGRVLSPRFSWGGAQFAIHRQACDGMVSAVKSLQAEKVLRELPHP